MPEPTRDRIRRIFLNRGPNFALVTAADLLGITMRELKRDIDDGAIVAVSTGVGMRVPKEELIAAAMRVWEQGVIEAALGDDAERVLPEAIRLVLLRARVPRYQRDLLVALEAAWDDRRCRAGARAGGRRVRARRGVGRGRAGA